jgi:hypothetical protein
MYGITIRTLAAIFARWQSHLHTGNHIHDIGNNLCMLAVILEHILQQYA